MSEWKVEGRYFDYGKEWWIVDENGHSVIGPILFPHNFPKPEIIEQIVREHNIHDALMGLAKSWRNHVGAELAVRRCKYRYQPNEWQTRMINWAQEEHTKANAVLAQAEGRE